MRAPRAVPMEITEVATRHVGLAPAPTGPEGVEASFGPLRDLAPTERTIGPFLLPYPPLR